MFIKLALHSLLDRKASVALAVLAMTVSIFVLLGVEHIRQQSKASFAHTVSGVDLIVGARTGDLNLLLYSVFRIGSPTNNISWQAYQQISSSSDVKWSVPLSLGDSHKGYRVLGTTTAYFEHYSFGQKHSLTFAQGHAFEQVLDVVLGAEVAAQLGYQLGDQLVLAHGIAHTSFSQHSDHPFTVVGILAATGTPVDHSLHVSLRGIEAIHASWQQGVKLPARHTQQDALKPQQLQPTSITAFMLGLQSKLATFNVQRRINHYSAEPLLAILPGVALSQLWSMMGILEKTLLLVSILVFVAACLGVSAMLMSSIRERNHEIQLLRVIGAPAWFLFLLIELETLFITLLSLLLGAALLSLTLFLAQDALATQFGLRIGINIFSVQSFYIMGAMLLASALVAVVPSLRGYSLARTKKT